MHRTVRLALAATAALSVGTSTQAGAALAPLPIDMSSAFNVDCTQERGVELVSGDCQGSTFTESFIVSDALEEGFPSGTVTFRKQPFKMGDVTLDSNNTADGSGQVIKAPGQKGYKYLQVLSMHTDGGPRKGGPLVITYTDKSTATIDLKPPAWDGAPPNAAWSGYKQGLLNLPTGGYSPVFGSKSSIFIEELPLNPKKAVATIKLPTFAKLRVFAMTLSNISSAPPKGPIFN